MWMYSYQKNHILEFGNDNEYGNILFFFFLQYTILNVKAVTKAERMRGTLFRLKLWEWGWQSAHRNSQLVQSLRPKEN